MKTTLNISERLHLMPLLPQEGSFVTLKLIRDLTNKLGLSNDEFTEFDVKQDGNKITWDVKKDIGKEFDFGLAETELIVKCLKQADTDGKLQQSHISIYEKFIS